MVALFQLLVLPYFMAAAAVAVKSQLVRQVEMAVVETALHQAQEQAELLTEVAVVVVVELLEHREMVVQVDQELLLLATQAQCKKQLAEL
jgi:hypothetical protein